MVFPVRRVALASLTCLVLAGCGGSDNSDDSGSNEDGGSQSASVGEEEGGAAEEGNADEGGDEGGGDEGSSVTINGYGALTWGDGPYGVVLAHGAAFDAASWQDQAIVLADAGATVVAVEMISPQAIGDAVTYLQDDGISNVALIGGSAGADSILRLASEQPDLPHQLILLSPNSPVDGLGEEPKLFIASEEEPVADVSTELADSAPGDNNEALLLPGSSHAQNIFDTDQGEPALDAMLEQFEEFASP